MCISRVNLRIYFLRTLTQKIVLLSLVWSHGDTNIILSFGDISVCGDHISIKFWGIIIKGVLSNIVPFGLGFKGSHNKFMLYLFFSNFNTIHSSIHVWVGSEAWNWIINDSWLEGGVLWCWMKILSNYTFR